MARGVGIAESDDDGIAFDLTLELFGNGLPLTRRCLHTEITVGRHTLAVHQHTDATLMSLRIKIAERHHVNTASGKVATVIQFKILRRHRRNNGQQHSKHHFPHIRIHLVVGLGHKGTNKRAKYQIYLSISKRKYLRRGQRYKKTRDSTNNRRKNSNFAGRLLKPNRLWKRN